MPDDLSPPVTAYLLARGLLRAAVAQRRPDQFVVGGWYTLPNGERGMVLRMAAGR